MENNNKEQFCNNCNAKLLDDAKFCHKCGVSLDAAYNFLSSNIDAKNITNDTDRNEKKLLNENNLSLLTFWIDFSNNYFKLPFSISLLFLIFGIIYAIFPYDLISEVAFINWLDDFLILLLVSINFFHCAIDKSEHITNTVFKRIKLILFFITIIVIFITWFSIKIISIIFMKN